MIAIAGRERTAITGSAEGVVTWWRAQPVRRTVTGIVQAIAFDATGGVQAVTRTGAVVHATTSSVATVIDHGAHRGASIPPDRLAVALDDGSVVIESLGPHTLDQLASPRPRDDLPSSNEPIGSDPDWTTVGSRLDDGRIPIGRWSAPDWTTVGSRLDDGRIPIGRR